MASKKKLKLQSFCYYGFTENGDSYHLACPECESEEIIILEYNPMRSFCKRLLGDKAQCWMCKNIFFCTENSWKLA
jgi:hypothetical protein